MAEPTPPTLPSELPVLPLRRTVAFPQTLQPLAVNRPVSIETVNRALGGDRLILLLLQDNDADDLLKQIVGKVKVRRFDTREASLHEIFVRSVGSDITERGAPHA